MTKQQKDGALDSFSRGEWFKKLSNAPFKGSYFERLWKFKLKRVKTGMNKD